MLAPNMLMEVNAGITNRARSESGSGCLSILTKEQQKFAEDGSQ